MTVKGGWTERDLLAFFCRCAIREGHSQTRALKLWRADGGRVSDTFFRQVWNATRYAMLSPPERAGRFVYDVEVNVTDRGAS